MQKFSELAARCLEMADLCTKLHVVGEGMINVQRKSRDLSRLVGGSADVDPAGIVKVLHTRRARTSFSTSGSMRTIIFGFACFFIQVDTENYL
jgi:hypothetical protein